MCPQEELFIATLWCLQLQVDKAGRDLQRSFCPTPLLKEGHSEQAAQGQMAFEYLQRWRLHNSLGNVCQHLVIFTAKSVLWYSDGTCVSVCAHCLFYTFFYLFLTSFISKCFNVQLYQQSKCDTMSMDTHCLAFSCFSTDCFHLLSFILWYTRKLTKERAFSIFFSAFRST